MSKGGARVNGYAEVTLDVEQIVAQQVVSREWLRNSTLTAHDDGGDAWLRNEIVYRLVRQIATVGGESITVPEIRVPDGWWQAFKERHFDVLLRWSPVRYRTLQHEQTWKAVEMLPNVELPESHRVGAVKVLVQR